MVVAPKKSPDPSYPTQVGSAHVAPRRKSRIPNPLAPNQPQGQRAARYKAPEVQEEELALIGWFRSLSYNEQESLRGQFQQDREPVGPDVLEELLQDYARELRNMGRARRTTEIYLGDLAKLQRFLSQTEQNITCMSINLVRQFTQYLSQQEYSRVSISRNLTVLKGFTRYLYREGILGLPQMPRPQVFITKVPKELPQHLSLEEIQKLLEAPDSLTPYGIRDRAIPELFYGSGIRLAELVGLDLEDLDLERMTFLVRHGKGDKQRVAFFGKPCQWALHRYLNESRPLLLEG